MKHEEHSGGDALTTSNRHPSRVFIPLSTHAILTISTLLLVLTTSLLFTLFIYRVSRDTLLQKTDQQLLTAALSSKEALPPDFHDTLIDPGSLPPARYAEIVARHNRLCRDLDMQYLWSCLMVGSNIVFTTATSPSHDIRNGDHARFFDIHHDPHAFDQVFRTMRTDYSSFHNEWGNGRMVLIPFRDAKGRPYCFGASMSTDSISRAQHALLKHCSVLGLTVMGLGMAMVLLISHLLTRPIRLLSASARHLARGAWTRPVPITCVKEVSELAEALETLRHSVADVLATHSTEEADLHVLMQNLSSAVIIHAPDSRILYCNPAAMTLLGLEASPPTGTGAPAPAWRFKREDGSSMPASEYPVNLVLAGGQAISNYVVGICVPNRSGITWMLVNAFPFLGKQGELRMVVVTFVDITPVRTAELAVRDSSAILNSFFESPGVMRGVVEVVDGDIRHLSDNATSAAFFGRTPHDMQHQMASTMGVPSAIIQSWIDRYEESRRLGKPVSFQYEHRSGDQSHWLHAVTSHIGKGHGGAERYTYAVTDVTEIKQLESQLQQAQKIEAIGQLAGGVAHEFNNVLQSILGYCDLMLATLAPEDPHRHDVLAIQSSGQRAADLTRQLLAFGRRQLLQPRGIDLNHLLSSLHKMLGKLLGEAITLEIDLQSIPSVRADAHQLEQVIMNLLLNARDSITGHGTITISTREVTLDQSAVQTLAEAIPGRFVCLSVSDTGTGIPEQDRARLFEPFFSTKGPGKGSGLGLSVTYGIVKQHQGWINVYSEVGHGSVFRVYLPATSGSHAAAPAAATTEGSRGQGERILLIEDEEPVLRSTERVLRSSGYQVDGVLNATEAWNRFSAPGAAYDIILSDVMLPDRNGIDLVTEMQDRQPRIAVVLCSGYADQDSRWPVIAQRGFLFLGKPYTSASLMSMLRRALAARPSRPL